MRLRLASPGTETYDTQQASQKAWWRLSAREVVLVVLAVLSTLAALFVALVFT